MPEIDKIEKAKRIRIVMEWIIDDYSTADIITQIKTKWGLEDRQAKRYLKLAREEWSKNEDELIEQKRRRKIETLKKLKRSLTDKHKGTPAGISAVLAVESKLIMLEGLEPPKRMELTGKNGKPLQVQSQNVGEIDVDQLPLEVLEQLYLARKNKSDDPEDGDNDPEEES